MKYTLWRIFKHRANFSNTIVHLQADLGTVPRPADIYPLQTKEMHATDGREIREWVDLINNAYNEDSPYDIDSARRHIEDHLFLDILKIYFVMDGDTPVATISIGKYRANPRIGGEARIAVRRDYQGRGLGRFVVCYGCDRLRDSGLELCENIVAIKRRRSIMLHFQCGFVPQYQNKYQQHVTQKRFLVVKLLATWTLLRYHRLYKTSFSRNLLLTESS